MPRLSPTRALWSAAALVLVAACSENPCPEGAEPAKPNETTTLCQRPDDTRHGPYEERWGAAPEAAKKTAGTYVDGKKDGIWRSFWENGKVRREQTFHADVEDGPEKEWSKDGKLVLEAQRKSGQRVGRWRFFRDDGTLEREESFDGVLHGAWLEYQPDGKTPRHEKTYRRGDLHGAWRRYDDGGNVVEEGQYVDNRKGGEWTTWLSREPGKELRRVTTWKEDVVVGAPRLLDKAGKEVDPRSLAGSTSDGFVVMNDVDGQRAAEGTLKGAKRDGEWTLYRDAEHRAATYSYRDGVRHGPFKWWSGDGTLIVEGTYEEGALKELRSHDLEPFGEGMTPWHTFDAPLGGALASIDSRRLVVATADGKVRGLHKEEEKWALDAVALDVARARGLPCRGQDTALVRARDQALLVHFASGSPCVTLPIDAAAPLGLLKDSALVGIGEELVAFAVDATARTRWKPGEEPLPVVEAWRVSLGGRITAVEPIGVYGSIDTVLVATAAGTVVALDGRTGAERFRHDEGAAVVDVAGGSGHRWVVVQEGERFRVRRYSLLDKAPAAPSWISPPLSARPWRLIDDLAFLSPERVIVPYREYHVGGVQGQVEVPLPTPVQLVGAVTEDKSVLFAKGGPSPELVGAQRGHVRFRWPLPEALRCGRMLMSEAGGDLILGCEGKPELWRRDVDDLVPSRRLPANKRVLWSTKDELAKPPLWSAQLPGVLVLAGDKQLVALSPHTGRRLWRRAPAKEAPGPAREPRLAGERLVLLEDAHLVALDVLSGRELWRYTELRGGCKPPVVAGGVAFVACASPDGGELIAVDLAHGVARWKRELVFGGDLDKVLQLLAHGDDVIVRGHDRIEAVRAAGADTRWQLAVSSDATAAMDGDRLYVCDGGAARAHDPATGEVLWTSEQKLLRCSGTPTVGPEGRVAFRGVVEAEGPDGMEEIDSDVWLEGGTGARLESYFPPPPDRESVLYEDELVRVVLDGEWRRRVLEGRDRRPWTLHARWNAHIAEGDEKGDGETSGTRSR